MKTKLLVASTVWILSALILSAQTSPANQASPPGAVLQKDYNELKIQANQLTAQELPAMRDRALAGDVRAQVILGMAYQLGCPGAPHDAAQALKWYHLAADQGSSIAANQIGASYDPHEGFAGAHGHNPDEALNWYRKSAARGDGVGQYNVGVLLRQMDRHAEAVPWLQKATESGLGIAAVDLGTMYKWGEVFPHQSKRENWKAAIDYFRPLANQGNAPAQFALGMAYRDGSLGVSRDEQEAVIWFRKAADQGLARAQLALGVHYLNGQGVPKDKAEAAKWLLKAADQEDGEAEAWLATLYESGEGVPKDRIEAFMWYSLARSREANATFHGRVTASERQEAEKRMYAYELAHGNITY